MTFGRLFAQFLAQMFGALCDDLHQPGDSHQKHRFQGVNGPSDFYHLCCVFVCFYCFGFGLLAKLWNIFHFIITLCVWFFGFAAHVQKTCEEIHLMQPIPTWVWCAKTGSARSGFWSLFYWLKVLYPGIAVLRQTNMFTNFCWFGFNLSTRSVV